MTIKYGAAPESMGVVDLEFEEYMHYMYLPIGITNEASGRMTERDFDVPKNLHFAFPLIDWAMASERDRGNEWQYIYVTARRGYATPGNPLNRPGWHADGFGTDDINYVWTDRYPTLFALGEFGDISEDHIESAKQFEERVEDSAGERYVFDTYGQTPPRVQIVTYENKMLQRLDNTVVHAAPEIPAPGGERSFFKVSFSNDKYNLKGNAHNYGLDYDWEMFDRQSVRNDPANAGKDSK